MSVEIFLDNYHNTCYPGQTLSGRVECFFNKQKTLRAVRVKFKGRAKTRWTESESYYDSTEKKHKSRQVTYTAEEDYFNAEYNLVAGGDGFTLPPGRHTYPFSYILPQQLPSSFEGSYGNIRYSITATVDRPWKFDYEHVLTLHITSPLDLNYIPGVKEPVALSVDKSVCCCCCRSGPLTFNVSLPVTGYIPGQDINIGAYVENMTNVSSEGVKFKIVKNVEHITHHPSTRHKYEDYTITKCVEGGIGAHGDKSWTTTLVIPDEAVPNLLSCNIINISYDLEAEVILPCPHSNLDLSIPIKIGTIPLQGVVTGLPGPPLLVPNYNAISNPLPPQPNAYPPPMPANAYPPPPTATAPPTDIVSNPTAPYQSAAPPYPISAESTSYPPITKNPIGFMDNTATAPPSYEEAKTMEEKK